MKKTLSRFWLKSALSVSLFLAGCVLVQFSQERAKKRKNQLSLPVRLRLLRKRRQRKSTKKFVRPSAFSGFRRGLEEVPSNNLPSQSPLHRLRQPPRPLRPRKRLLKQLHRHRRRTRLPLGLRRPYPQLQQPKLLLLQRLILARASGLSA